jgi:thioredoxin 1
MQHVDSTTAGEAIAASDGIVLVDLSAEWCPPCRALEPALEQLADETPDLTLLCIDVDASPELPRRYDVMSFPTLLFFVAGRLVHRLVGARGLASIREVFARVRTAVPSSP